MTDEARLPISDATIAAFTRAFRGRENAHGRYTPLPNNERDVKTLTEPAPPELWRSHLAGQLPFLGTVPITQDNTCYWGCIDIDDDGIDLAALEGVIADLGLPLTVFRSKSGGAHLFAFFSEPVPAKLVIEKLKEWRHALNYDKNHDGREVEVFPKQATLKPSGTGNWVNLPYWNARDTNRYAIRNGQPLSLEDALALIETRRISEATLRGMRTKRALLPTMPDPADPFNDGPPCLQTLHKRGWTEGSRNLALFNIALFHKLAFEGTWREMTLEFNQKHFSPPLPPSETDLVLDSIERHEYVYRCSDLPIEPVCQKAECKKRQWGILAFRARDIEKQFPVLADLTKVTTDPPLWRLKVDGQEVEFATDDLILLPRFRKVVLEKRSIITPMITQGVWDNKLRKLLETHTVIEAPPDAGVIGDFRALLAAFLMLRSYATKRDDILLGKPYQEDAHSAVLFRAQDLLGFLKRKNFRDYSTGKVYSILRGMGASHTQVKCAGINVKVWALPIPDDVTEEEDAEMEMPVTPTPRF